MNLVTKFLMLVLLCVSSSHAFAVSESLQSQIEALIGAVAQSQCVFIRNGKQHTARESVKHISRKYAHFENEIDSIERFVDLTASRSLMTGKAYEVECEGLSMTSQSWMLDKAAELGFFEVPAESS